MKKNILIALSFACMSALFVSCEPNNHYRIDLSDYEGVYSGLYRSHHTYRDVATGNVINTDTSYTISIRVRDLGNGFFSAQSDQFNWLDSVHNMYYFDFANRREPTGIYFASGADSIYISQDFRGGDGGLPIYLENFEGKK